jgi:hypothetical protein
MCLAFKAEQIIEKSAVTKQGAFNCAFGMAKKGVIRTVQPTCWTQHRILTKNMANQAFIGECTLAVTYDMQTDADRRDRIVYYIITNRNNEL